MRWVVFYGRSRASLHKLLIDLGRYSYRVALENRCITHIDAENRRVTFTWPDYRSGGHVRFMALPAFTFIGRFLLHILAHGFMKICYYGLYARGLKRELLNRCGTASLLPPGPSAVFSGTFSSVIKPTQPLFPCLLSIACDPWVHFPCSSQTHITHRSGQTPPRPMLQHCPNGSVQQILWSIPAPPSRFIQC